MKPVKKFQLLILIFFIGCGLGYIPEEVEWENPAVYEAQQFSFTSDSVQFESRNCKIFEIRTTSGVTGYFIVGKSKIEIASKNISENVTNVMLRFNPDDVDSFVRIREMKPISDEGFVKSSKIVLDSSFRHCYHANMDAIIPRRGCYALNFFTGKSGEILASYYNGNAIYFNFTTRKKL